MDHDEYIRPSEPPQAFRWRSSAWEVLKTLVLVLFLVVTIRTFVVEAYVIHGKSMEPTFFESERLLIEKFAPRFETLERGDIIIFNHPHDPGKRLIKRIIGLPGERVRIDRGIVYINGKPLEEPWLEKAERDGSHHDEELVPEGAYFVLGDNREISNDSRRIGTIARGDIVGKYLFRFYPLVSNGRH